MLHFNKLRWIVYEIFDNSQLFLTYPGILNTGCLAPNICYSNNFIAMLSMAVNYYFIKIYACNL